MPIQFTCPHCGAATAVADEFAGQRGPCAACLNTIEIPPLPSTWHAAERDDAVPAFRGNGRFTLVVLAALGALIVGVALFAGRMLPNLFEAQLSQQDLACRDRLERIAQALRAYHAEYDQFPPATVLAADGRPLHSWRVLILPYLDEDELYRQYHFDEAWDSPRNKRLASKMPEVFGCPGDPASYQGQTSYVAVVGPQTAWPPGGTVRLRDRPQSIESKLLVVESEGSGIGWLEPQDLRVDLISHRINDPQGAGIRSLHLDGANAVLVSGKFKHLPTNLRAEQLVELLSIPPAAP